MAWFPPHYLSASPFPPLLCPATAETHRQQPDPFHTAITTPVTHTLRSTCFSCHRRFPDLPAADLPLQTRWTCLLAESQCKILLWKGGPIQASAASSCSPFCSFKHIVVTQIHLISTRPETNTVQDFCRSDEQSATFLPQLSNWKARKGLVPASSLFVLQIHTPYYLQTCPRVGITSVWGNKATVELE